MKKNKLSIAIIAGLVLLIIISVVVLLAPQTPKGVNEDGYNPETEVEDGSNTFNQVQFRSSGDLYDKLLPDQYEWVKAEVGRFAKLEKGENVSYFSLVSSETLNNGTIVFRFTIDDKPETYSANLEIRPRNELDLTIPGHNFTSNNQQPINEGSFDHVHDQ